MEKGMRTLVFMLLLLSAPLFAIGREISDVATGKGTHRSTACTNARENVISPSLPYPYYIGECSCYKEKEGVISWWICEVPYSYSWEIESRDRDIEDILKDRQEK